MIIKFSCKNNCQNFTKTDKQLEEDKFVLHFCPYCGEKIHIDNLPDIVLADSIQKVRENIRKWGLEYSLEIVKRNLTMPGINLYIEEFKSKGVWK